MKLIDIQSSPRGEYSDSISLTRSFIEACKSDNPSIVVDTLNVWHEGLPEFDHEAIGGKYFHWHMSGGHFRDYHLLLDEQAEQLFAMTDDNAERARKIGGTRLHSVSDISRHQRLKDNNQESVGAGAMLVELCADNRELATFLRSAHQMCETHNDVATTSLIENWLDQTERRVWFLAATIREF